MAPFFKRPDGTHIKGLHSFRQMIPYLMRSRNESILYYDIQCDLAKTLPFIEKYNKKLKDTDEKLTLFHVVMNSVVRTLSDRPQLNRYVSGLRYYQRNVISVNFIVKKELTEKGQEVNAKVNFSPYETLDTIKPKCKKTIKKARSKEKAQDEKETDFFVKLPRSVLRLIMWVFRKLDYYNLAPKSMVLADPMHSSAFVASLGSLGLDSLHHHLFEWGNNGLFLLIGKIKKVPAVDDSGKVVAREVVELAVSLDDRISEGIYFKGALDRVQHFVENPADLTKKPVYDPEVMKELNLKDYPLDN